MKRYAALLLILAAMTAHAATKPITLTWTASPTSTTAVPGTVSLYSAPGTCPASGIGTLTYAVIASNQAPAGTYSYAPAAPGSYCIYAVAVIGGATSLPSDTFQGITTTVLPLPPVLAGTNP